MATTTWAARVTGPEFQASEWTGRGLAPEQVTGLVVTTTSGTTLHLDWDALVPPPVSYRVERSLTAVGGFVEVGSSATPSYDDVALAGDTTYYYRVRAQAGGGLGPYSDVASGLTTFFESSAVAGGWAAWSARHGTLQAAAGAAASADLDPVGQWQDQTANARHLAQLTAANKPLLRTNVLASRYPVLRTDGVQKILTAAIGTLAQPFTLVAVLRQNGGTSFLDNRTGAVSQVLGYQFNTTQGSIFAGTDLKWPRTIPAGFNVLVLVLNGANSYVRVNGVEMARGAAGANSLDGLTLGASKTPSGFSRTDFAEVAIWPRELDAGELSTLEAGWMHFYGLPTNGAMYSMFGGLAENSITSAGTLTGNTTYITGNVRERCRPRGGTIREIVVQVNTGGSGFKLKVFRVNGASYDFVGESESLTLAAGRNTVPIASPPACLPGDVFGLYVPTGAVVNSTATGLTVLSAAGDITGSNAFATSAGNSLSMEVRGSNPVIGYTGDSYIEGHNTGQTGQKWHTYLDVNAGPAGDPTAEPAYAVSLLNANYAEYQNFGLGGQTFSWVAGTGMPLLVAQNPTGPIVVHCGLNDVALGRTWAQVEADLNTIKGLLKVGMHLFVDEILPYTGGTAGNNDTIRTWNTSLAVWCAANDATLISCHEALADPANNNRLAPAYNAADNTHLTKAGVDVLAVQIETALRGYYGS